MEQIVGDPLIKLKAKACAGNKNIVNEAEMQKDFAFRTDSELVHWNSDLVYQLCPKIAKEQAKNGDSAEKKYWPDMRCEPNLVEKFLSLSLGREVEIKDRKEAKFFLKFAREVGNKDIGLQIHKSGICAAKMSLQKRVGRLYDMSGTGEEYQEDIDFLAARMGRLQKSILVWLGLDAVLKILSSDRLVCKSEDQLYNKLVKVFDGLKREGESEEACFRLFSTVRFEHLSTTCMEKFCSFCGKFLHVIDSEMWERLSTRLCSEVKTHKETEGNDDSFEYKVVMVGLDGSGKTSALYQLQIDDLVSTTPTSGYVREKVKCKGMPLQVWDLAGKGKLKSLWRRYMKKAWAVIFVVDAADKSRFDEARDALHGFVERHVPAGLPLLVYANKQDCDGAAQPDEVVSALELEKFTDRPWRCFKSSNMQCPCVDLVTGLEWLVDEIKKEEMARSQINY